MDLFVSTSCPQCGADISFEEESNVIRCNFCGSALRLTGRSGVTRTYVEPREDVVRMKKAIHGAIKQSGNAKPLVSGKKLFFAPYWRLKGMAFRWIFGKDAQNNAIKELKTKQLDHTFPAYHGMNLGLQSLGIRPGALKLRFFDRSRMSEMGAIMKVALPFEKAADHGTPLMQMGLDETGLQVHLESTHLVGERYSIIYFPFWMIKVSVGQESRILILDGVANTITGTLTQQEWVHMVKRAENAPEPVSFKQVSFIPFKCPNCGWDLPLHQFDFIHLCTTCRRAWLERGGQFRAVAFEVASSENRTGQPLVYLPFWVFHVEIGSKEQRLKTVADLHAFSLMFPTRVPKDNDDALLRFFIPAMEIRNIVAANKLATSVTNTQPTTDYMPKESLGECKLSGAFLPPKAAKEMAHVLLHSLTPKNNRKRQEFVENAEISIGKMHLLWWPFFEQRLFLRDALCGCGIQKGTVAMGNENGAGSSSIGLGNLQS
jgi:ribosomal protein S27E